MWWFQLLMRDNDAYAQRYPQKLGKVVTGDHIQSAEVLGPWKKGTNGSTF